MFRFLRIFVKTSVKILLLMIAIACVHFIGMFGYVFAGPIGVLIGYFLGITLFVSAIVYYSENL